MKMYRLVLAFFFVLAMAGCGGGSGDLSQVGSISGRAVNAAGQPVSGAQVSLVPVGRASRAISNRTTTDVEGRFLLENVAAGTYTLSIVATGPGGETADVQVSITVPEGSTVDITLRISMTGGGVIPSPGFGAISGRVLDEAGNPVVGVRVKGEREPNGPEVRTFTDGDGLFFLDDLRPGVWKIWADPPGPERSDRVWIDVDSDEEVQTTLIMEDRNFDDDNDHEDDDDDEDDD